MSNKARRQRKQAGRVRPAGADRNSAKITLGEGAAAYTEDTLALIRGIVPGVDIIHPLGVKNEFDSDRLSRARAMANYHRRPHCAVVRVESLTTRYFQELVLGSAHELHVMRSKIQTINREDPCPFGTVIVVFKPGHKDRIENGMCSIYWEHA